MDDDEERGFFRLLLFVMCFGLFANICYNKDLLERRIKFFTFTFSAAVTFSNSAQEK